MKNLFWTPLQYTIDQSSKMDDMLSDLLTMTSSLYTIAYASMD